METRLLRLMQVLLMVLLVPQFARATVDTAWVRRYDGPRHGHDWATALAVDSAGNVYVAGVSAADTGYRNLDFVVIKYFPNGDTAWVRRRDFGGDDSPSGLAVDAQGNVYVSGTTGNNRIATVKYSSTGQPVWSRMFDSRAQGNGLGLDAEGNVIVFGDTLTPPPTTTSDVAVLKYLPNGDTAWARFYDWAGYDDAADAMAITPEGDVCIGGFCVDANPGGNVLVLRYGATGTLLWSAFYDGPQHGSDWANDIAADQDGNTIVTGVSDNGYGTPPDYLTVKYNPAGETVWVRRYNGTANDWDEARAVAVDVLGNAYVTGSARYTDTRGDFTTIKYRPDGSVAWIVRYDGPAHSGDGAYAIAVADDGRVYVTGNSFDPQTLADCATVCYDSSGEVVWVKRYNSPSNWAEYTTELALGPCGAVCVAGIGYTAGSASSDILTIKYVQSGGGVEERSVPSAQAALPALEAGPSPFTARTAISFRLTDMVRANVVVFDAVGRPVRTLVESRLPAGVHSVVWDRTDDDGQRVPPGVYTVRLTAEQTKQNLKVLVLD